MSQGVTMCIRLSPSCMCLHTHSRSYALSQAQRFRFQNRTYPEEQIIEYQKQEQQRERGEDSYRTCVSTIGNNASLDPHKHITSSPIEPFKDERQIPWQTFIIRIKMMHSTMIIIIISTKEEERRKRITTRRQRLTRWRRADDNRGGGRRREIPVCVWVRCGWPSSYPPTPHPHLTGVVPTGRHHYRCGRSLPEVTKPNGARSSPEDVLDRKQLYVSTNLICKSENDIRRWWLCLDVRVTGGQAEGKIENLFAGIRGTRPWQGLRWTDMEKPLCRKW